MTRHRFDLESALGALALMLGAIGLLAVWSFQCVGHRNRGLMLADLDDRVLRDLGLSRATVAAHAGRTGRRP